MERKNLLVFFGELRTFEYVIPQLSNLNKVDVIISTWSETTSNDGIIQINKEKINKIYPNIKKIFISNLTDEQNKLKTDDDTIIKNNNWKIFYHWNLVINSIRNINDYDKIIFHRCDLISNWEKILDMELDANKIYLHFENYNKPHFKDNKNVFWVNDYYFFGHSKIIKKFIKLFTYKNYSHRMSSHYNIWEIIYNHNIQIEKYILRGALLKKDDIDFWKSQKQKSNIMDLALLTRIND